MSDLATHKKSCGVNRMHYCAYETSEQKCGFYSDLGIFEHYTESHLVTEISTVNDLIIIPHLQIQFNMRDLDKPLKSFHSLPCFASLYYINILNFKNTKVLFEFFYRLKTRTFLFIFRSEQPVALQLQLLVPKFSVFGLSSCLQSDQVEIREGNSTNFASNVPMHMDQSDSIRNICSFELDVFEVFEKYSLLHGDCRFVQFGVKLH